MPCLFWLRNSNKVKRYITHLNVERSLILLWAVLYGLYFVLGEWNVAPSKTLLSIPGEETDFGDQDLEFHDAYKGIDYLLFPNLWNCSMEAGVQDLAKN